MNKKIILIGLVSSVFIFNGCTPEEQALASGLAVGTIAGAAITSYSYPVYYDQPYYYYGGRYYYGGYYRHGYYYHHGHRYYNGHYYYNGYRYHNGRRYRAVHGKYGYYHRGHGGGSLSNHKKYKKHTKTGSSLGNRNGYNRGSYNRGSYNRGSYNRGRIRPVSSRGRR